MILKTLLKTYRTARKLEAVYDDTLRRIGRVEQAAIRARQAVSARKKAILIGAAAGCAAALPFMLLAPGRASRQKKAPFLGRNFAHRGLHKADKSVPENSLAAFRAAVAEGYGMELDVRLSRDGRVVVFHDNTLVRICGVDARVDELTYEELRELRLCGTAEAIPLLSEVLEAVGGRVPLIVELKTGKRRRELCEKTYALLRAYRGAACVESFDPMVVAWFRFRAPELLRGQLASPKAEYDKSGVPGFRGFLLSNTLFNAVARPQFIAYKLGPRPLAVRFAEKLGAMRVGWTAHNTYAEKGRDAVIFEFCRPAIKYK